MFILTAKMPKRRTLLFAALAALSVVLLFTLVCCGRDGAGETPRSDASTNEGRIAYLSSLGWEASPEPIETLELTLPDELVEPYLSYNEMQLRQGFDLAPYCGKTLMRCTYALTNYPGRTGGCQADLYVCDGTVVAGDVVCTGENGFIATLEFPSAE